MEATKQVSPQTELKVAAEEIKEVLRNHGMAGAVQLHLPNHGEFFVHLHTPYSCIYMVDDNEVRISSKLENYDSVKHQMAVQRDSSNMLKILTDITAINFTTLRTLSGSLDAKLNAVHEPGVLKTNSGRDVLKPTDNDVALVGVCIKHPETGKKVVKWRDKFFSISIANQWKWGQNRIVYFVPNDKEMATSIKKRF